MKKSLKINNKTTKKNSYITGIRAEKIAIIWLKLLGYSIIANRHRNVFGEIDIVAVRGKKIFFIEVKSRQDYKNSEPLTYRQSKRIKNAANLFLAKYPNFTVYEASFNLIVIRSWLFFRHYHNFW